MSSTLAGALALSASLVMALAASQAQAQRFDTIPDLERI